MAIESLINNIAQCFQAYRPVNLLSSSCLHPIHAVSETNVIYRAGLAVVGKSLPGCATYVVGLPASAYVHMYEHLE